MAKKREEQVLRYGRVIEIEGDAFFVTLPTYREMHNITRMIIDTEIIPSKQAEAFKKIPYFYFMVNGHDNLQELVWQKGCNIPLMATTGKVIATASGWKISPSSTSKGKDDDFHFQYIGFRPILIPLCADGTPDKSIANYHSNGDVVMGGTLYIENKSIPMPKTPEQAYGYDSYSNQELIKNEKDRSIRINNEETKMFCIKNTVKGKALRWVFLDGIFILEYPIAFISASTVWHQLCCSKIGGRK